MSVAPPWDCGPNPIRSGGQPRMQYPCSAGSGAPPMAPLRIARPLGMFDRTIRFVKEAP